LRLFLGLRLRNYFLSVADCILTRETINVSSFFQTATYDGRGFAREGLGSGLGQVGEVLLVVEHPGAGDPGDGRTRDPRREVGDDGAQGDDDEGEEDFLLQECKKKDARIIQEEANNKHVLKNF